MAKKLLEQVAISTGLWRRGKQQVVQLAHYGIQSGREVWGTRRKADMGNPCTAPARHPWEKRVSVQVPRHGHFTSVWPSEVQDVQHLYTGGTSSLPGCTLGDRE